MPAAGRRLTPARLSGYRKTSTTDPRPHVDNPTMAWAPESVEVQQSKGIEVLRLARVLISRGWCHHAMAVRLPGGDIAYSLSGAISEAGEAGLVAEYARRILRKYIGEIGAWNDHPLRRKREVLALLDRCILEIGRGVARIHRGGWSIGAAR